MSEMRFKTERIAPALSTLASLLRDEAYLKICSKFSDKAEVEKAKADPEGYLRAEGLTLPIGCTVRIDSIIICIAVDDVGDHYVCLRYSDEDGFKIIFI